MEQAHHGTTDGQTAAQHATRLSSLQAIGIIVALVPIIAGLIILGAALHVEGLFMGFLFAVYWGSVKHLVMAEFAPTLIGGLAAIGLAYLFYALPLISPAVGLIGLGLLIVAIYCSMRRMLPMVFNPAFMIFLTVATIPLLTAKHDYVGMAIGTVLGAAYSLVIFFAVTRIAKMFRSGARSAAMPVAEHA